MSVKITSNVPYLTELNGNFVLEKNVCVKDYLTSLNVKWDKDALVLLNGKYCEGNEELKAGDHILLLVPISGG